jgi:hypothetical protein
LRLPLHRQLHTAVCEQGGRHHGRQPTGGEQFDWCCVLTTPLPPPQIVGKVGGTVDDSQMVDGLVLDHKAAKAAGGPTRVENAKIALIQVLVAAD